MRLVSPKCSLIPRGEQCGQYPHMVFVELISISVCSVTQKYQDSFLTDCPLINIFTVCNSILITVINKVEVTMFYICLWSLNRWGE